ncbi:MAG: SpoVG family protein [Clostridia bacterium]|nr:SpoVG family protein [Clostridia bacterium]
MAASKKGGVGMAKEKEPDKKNAPDRKQSEEAEIKARIDRIFDDPNSKLKAVASVNLPGGFAVHNVRLYENEKGRWVSMPQSPYKDAYGNTKYEDIFHPVTAEARSRFNDAVSGEYDRALEMRQQNGQTAENAAAEQNDIPEEDLGVKM